MLGSSGERTAAPSAPYTVAVLGAGNGGQALAGHLALQGHRVHLYNRDDTEEVARYLKPIRRENGITLEGVLNGKADIPVVTTDLREATEGADCVCVVVPALAHRAVARGLAPLLRPDLPVLLLPGRTFGTSAFFRHLREAGYAGDVALAEAHSLPYACRLAGAEGGAVRVSRVKPFVYLYAMGTQASLRERAERIAASILPGVQTVQSVLHMGLLNLGALFHPTITLLNAGAIEREDPFFFYIDGVTEAVASALEALDGERLALGDELGWELPSALEMTRTLYGVEAESLSTALKGNAAYRVAVAPTTLWHRYLLEDVPTGLVPMISLGETLGVPTPNMKALLVLAEMAVRGRGRFWENGRRLDRWGLGRREVLQLAEGEGMEDVLS